MTDQIRHKEWQSRIHAAIGHDTPEGLRDVAKINEDDPEVGPGIADGQRRYAALIELAREMVTAISDGDARAALAVEAAKRATVAILKANEERLSDGFQWYAGMEDGDVDDLLNKMAESVGDAVRAALEPPK